MMRDGEKVEDELESVWLRQQSDWYKALLGLICSPTQSVTRRGSRLVRLTTELEQTVS